MDKMLITVTLDELREVLATTIRDAVYEAMKQAISETSGNDLRRRVTAQEVSKMYNVGLMAVRNWEKKGLKRIEGRGSSALYYIEDVEGVAKQRYKRDRKS